MKVDDLFEFGFLSRTHGLKGELILQVSEFPTVELSKIDVVFSVQNDSVTPFFVASIKGIEETPLIKIEEIDSVENAKKLKGMKLYLPLTMRVIDAGFNIDHLINFNLIDQNYGDLGTVLDVMNIPNNPLLMLVYKGKEVLVPIADSFIQKIEEEKQIIYTQLPDGLVELYLDNVHQKDDGD